MDDFRVLNRDGLRWPDEFVRHKVLDLLGDLALLGMPIEGHLVVERGGHALHQRFVRALLEHPSHWTVETRRRLARRVARASGRAGARIGLSRPPRLVLDGLLELSRQPAAAAASVKATPMPPGRDFARTWVARPDAAR